MAIRRNLYLFNLHHFCAGLWLFSALAIIYFEQITGSYALAMLAFSMVNLSQSLMEVPCGVISDRIGRKQTMVMSAMILFINMLFWAAAGSLNQPWMLYAGSVLRGIGLALISGTGTAMIFETLADIKKKKIFDKIYSRASGYHQLGLVISALTATVVTYYFSILALVWLSILPAFAKIIIALLMIEPKNNFEKGISPLAQVKKSINLLVKKKKLRNYSLLKMFDGALIMSIFRFENLYYQMLIPIYLINIVRMIQHSIGCVSFWIIPWVRNLGMLRLLYLSSFGNALVRLIGLAMNNALTPFFTASQNLFFGIGSTAQETLLQKEYHKSLRATMSSITDLFGGIIVAILGYALGLLADYSNPRMALFISLIGQIIMALIYRRLFYIYKK